MSVLRVIEVHRVWCAEVADDCSVLKLCCQTEGARLRVFWSDIALDRPRRMRFEFVELIDGFSIYQATEIRPDVCEIAESHEPLVKLRMANIMAAWADALAGVHREWKDAFGRRIRDRGFRGARS